MLPAERLSYECLQLGWTDSRKIQELLHLLPAKGQTRNTSRQAQMLHIHKYSPKTFAVGAYSHGPHYGIMRNTKAFPYTTLLIAYQEDVGMSILLFGCNSVQLLVRLAQGR